MSTDGLEKLQKDLDILAAMAAEMDTYLRSDVLFWPMQNSDFPRLTLGGYLMRQHRLLALKELLDQDEQNRLIAAVETYRQALVEKIVRLETKAHEELEYRLRQWERFLQEIGQESSSPAYYATSVDIRAMIAALMNQLQIAPYRLPPRAEERLSLLDRNLRSRFRQGEFVWPEEWQGAYPPSRYWWLFGQPG